MKKKLSILAFASYTALVALVSLQPSSGVAIGSWDKTAHFLTYAVFAVLAWAISRSPRYFVCLCLVIIAYGVLLEYGQSFVPGRHMSMADVLANTAGVVVAAVGCMKIYPRKPNPETMTSSR